MDHMSPTPSKYTNLINKSSWLSVQRMIQLTIWGYVCFRPVITSWGTNYSILCPIQQYCIISLLPFTVLVKCFIWLHYCFVGFNLIKDAIKMIKIKMEQLMVALIVGNYIPRCWGEGCRGEKTGWDGRVCSHKSCFVRFITALLSL